MDQLGQRTGRKYLPPHPALAEGLSAHLATLMAQL